MTWKYGGARTENGPVFFCENTNAVCELKMKAVVTHRMVCIVTVYHRQSATMITVHEIVFYMYQTIQLIFSA